MNRNPVRFSLRVAFALSALGLLAAAPSALAQQLRNYSSSAEYKTLLSNEDIDGATLAADPSPSPKPQYGQTNSTYPKYQSRFSHLAFLAGGGFNTPIANTGRYSTWGGNLRAGAGWNFSSHFGLLAEFEFNRDKLTGAALAQSGAPGGHINTYGITLDPILYFRTQAKSSIYLTGGGGWYHKSTIYTAPVPVTYCNYYGFCGSGYQNQTIASFGQNAGGMNIGAGLTFKVFEPDSRAKLFTEARYEWMDFPSSTPIAPRQGTTAIVPVTIGIRF